MNRIASSAIALASIMGSLAAPPAFADATKPPASGILFDPATADVAGINAKSFKVSIVAAGTGKALQAETAASNGYPDFDFPAPAGGWDFTGLGGVQVNVTNSGQTDAMVGLRLDNEGEWAKKPYNTEFVKLAPGESKPIKVTFGMSYHSAGFALDTAHVIRVKMFLLSPKPPTIITVKELKTFPKSEAANPAAAMNPAAVSGLTLLADRNKPITPAAWVGTRPPVAGDWVQTFDDKFTGTKLNDKLWTPSWNGMIPNQLQSYTKDEVIVSNGVLRIQSEKKPSHMKDDPALPVREYSSGFIETFDKWSQLYGYFEARIKLPSARGLWPAFWMMPDRGPSAGRPGLRASTDAPGMEIDIMEYLTEWGPGRYNIAAHWDGYGANHQHWGNSSTYYGKTKDDWHTWGVLWEPGKLTWYCDGIKTAEWANSRVGSIPAYMILNGQIGGWATKDVDDAKLPDAMEVSYVRAWQLKSRIKP